MHKQVFIFDRETFEVRGQFEYPGEGWGITQNGTHLIMSDGTPNLRFLDPETFTEVKKIQVTYRGSPVRNINELEWVEDEVYANVWQTDWILRINPETGVVTGLADMTGLLPAGTISEPRNHVLNGIAYDAENDRLFVTGKNWPTLFEVKLK